jgi:hypothetical protein
LEKSGASILNSGDQNSLSRRKVNVYQMAGTLSVPKRYYFPFVIAGFLDFAHHLAF